MGVQMGEMSKLGCLDDLSEKWVDSLYYLYVVFGSHKPDIPLRPTVSSTDNPCGGGVEYLHR
jgi:hypothetical protein